MVLAARKLFRSNFQKKYQHWQKNNGWAWKVLQRTFFPSRGWFLMASRGLVFYVCYRNPRRSVIVWRMLAKKGLNKHSGKSSQQRVHEVCASNHRRRSAKTLIRRRGVFSVLELFVACSWSLCEVSMTCSRQAHFIDVSWKHHVFMKASWPNCSTGVSGCII